MNPQGQGPRNAAAGINIPVDSIVSEFTQATEEAARLNQSLRGLGIGTSAASPSQGLDVPALKKQVAEAESLLSRLHSIHETIRRETSDVQRSLEDMRRAMSAAQSAHSSMRRTATGVGATTPNSGKPQTPYGYSQYTPTHQDRIVAQKNFDEDLKQLLRNFDVLVKQKIDQALGSRVNDWLTKNGGNLINAQGKFIVKDRRSGEMWTEATEMVKRIVARQVGAPSSGQMGSHLHGKSEAELRSIVGRAVDEALRRFSNLQRIDEQQTVSSAPRYVQAQMLQGMWDEQLKSRRNPVINLETRTNNSSMSQFYNSLQAAGIDPYAFRTFMAASGYRGGVSHKNPLTEAPVRQIVLDWLSQHYRTSGRSDLAELKNLLAAVPPSGAGAVDQQGNVIPYMPITRTAQGWQAQRMLNRYGRVSSGRAGEGSFAEPDFIAPIAIFAHKNPQQVQGYLQSAMQWQGSSHGVLSMMNLYTGNLGPNPGQRVLMQGGGGEATEGVSASFMPSDLNNQLRLSASERQEIGRVISSLIQRRSASSGADKAKLSAELGDLLRALTVANAPLYGNNLLDFAMGGGKATVSKGAIGQYLASAGTELGTIIEALQQGTLPIIGYQGQQFPLRQLQRISHRLSPDVATTPNSFVRPLQALVGQTIRQFKQFHAGAGREWFMSVSKGAGIGEFFLRDAKGGKIGPRSGPEDVWRMYSSLPSMEEALALAAANFGGSDTTFSRDVAEAFKRAGVNQGEEGTVTLNAEVLGKLQNHFTEFRKAVSKSFSESGIGGGIPAARAHYQDLMRKLGEVFPKADGTQGKWGAGGAYINQAMRLLGEKLGLPVGAGGLGGGILTPLAPEFMTPSSLGILSAARMGGSLEGFDPRTHASKARGIYARDPHYNALYGELGNLEHQGYGLIRLYKEASKMQYRMPSGKSVPLLEAISSGDAGALEFAQKTIGIRPYYDMTGMTPEVMKRDLPGLSEKQIENMRRRTLLETIGPERFGKYLSAVSRGTLVTQNAAQYLGMLAGMKPTEVMANEPAALSSALGVSGRSGFVTLDDLISRWADLTQQRYQPGGPGLAEIQALSAGIHGAKATGELPPYIVKDIQVLAERFGAWPSDKISGEGGALMNAIHEHFPSEGAGLGVMHPETGFGIGQGAASLDAIFAPLNQLAQSIASLSQSIGSLSEGLGVLKGGLGGGSSSQQGGRGGAGGGTPPKSPPPPSGGSPVEEPSGGGRDEGGWSKRKIWPHHEIPDLVKNLQEEFDLQALEAAYKQNIDTSIEEARKWYAPQTSFGAFGGRYRMGTEEANVGIEFRPDVEGNLQRHVRGDVNATSLRQAQMHAENLSNLIFSKLEESLQGKNLSAEQVQQARARYALETGVLGQKVASGSIGSGIASTSVDYVVTGSGVQAIPRGHAGGLITTSRGDLPGVLEALEQAEKTKARSMAAERLGAGASSADIDRATRQDLLEMMGENIRPINVADEYGNISRRMLRWGLGANAQGGVEPKLQDVAPEGRVFRSLDEVAVHADRLRIVFDELSRNAQSAGSALGTAGRGFHGEIGREKMRVAGQEVGVRFVRTASGQVISSPEMGSAIHALPTPESHQEVQSLLKMRAQEIEKSLDELARVPGIGNVRSPGRIYDTVNVGWTSPGGNTLLQQKYNLQQTPQGVQPVAEPTHMSFARVGSDVSKAVEKVGLWAVATGAVYNFMAAVRGAYDLMVKFENEMATSRVLQPGYSNMDKVRKEFVGISKEYGQSLTGVAEAAHLWERQYKNVYQVLELTRQSIKLSRVDNIDLAEANKYLESTMNEMGFSVSDVGRIVDSWTSVTNKAQVTLQDLAEGVARAGGAAKLAGVGFDTLNGLIAAGVRSTGAAGHEIGNMLKTVFGKMYTADATRELNQVGVATHEVVDGVRELRPAQDILGELASKWHGLTRAQQESIALSVAGGVRQWSRLAAIMNDYSTAIDAASASSQGFNAANREVQIRLDTLLGQYSKLKSSMQGVMQNSFFEAGGLHMARAGVGMAQNAVNVVGAMPPFLQGGLVHGLYGAAGMASINMMSRIFGGDALLSMNHLRTLANAGIATQLAQGGSAPVGGLAGAINGAAGVVGRARAGASGWLAESGWGRALQAGWAAQPSTFGLQPGSAAGVATAAEKVAGSFYGIVGAVGGVIRYMGNLAKVVATAALVFAAIQGIGSAIRYFGTSPSERAVQRMQNAQIERRPFYEAQTRLSQLSEEERKYGGLGLAQQIERSDLLESVNKFASRNGISVSGTEDGLLQLDRGERNAFLQSYGYDLRDYGRGKTGRLSESMASMRGIVSWLPEGMSRMNGIQEAENLRGLASAIGGKTAGLNTSQQQGIFMEHIGQSMRDMTQRLGIPVAEVRQNATPYEIFEAIKPHRSVVTGSGAISAWGQAAAAGKEAWLYSRTGDEGSPSDRRIYNLGWDKQRGKYALSTLANDGSTKLVQFFSTIDEAKKHVSGLGDHFKAVAGDRKSQITFNEVTKSVEKFDDSLKRIGQTSSEVTRILSSVNKQFTTSGVTVGVGTYGAGATGKFLSPMAGSLNMMYQSSRTYYSAMEQATVQRQILQSAIGKKRQKGDNRTDEEIISEARRDAASAEKDQAGSANALSIEIAEADKSLNGYLDTARKALDTTRQTAEALRDAVENIKSLQDSSLELYDVWSGLGQAVKQSRDAAWGFYEMQKSIASERMGTSLLSSLGLGGSQHENAIALDKKYEEAASRAAGQLASSYVGGAAANARVFGGTMPEGVALPGFASNAPSAYSLLEKQLSSAADLASSSPYSGGPEQVLRQAATTFLRAVGIFSQAVGAGVGAVDVGSSGVQTSNGSIVGAGLAEGGFAERVIAQSPRKSKDSFLAWLNKGEYVVPAGMAAILAPALERSRTSGGIGSTLESLRGIRGFAEGGYTYKDFYRLPYEERMLHPRWKTYAFRAARSWNPEGFSDLAELVRSTRGTPIEEQFNNWLSKNVATLGRKGPGFMRALEKALSETSSPLPGQEPNLAPTLQSDLAREVVRRYTEKHGRIPRVKDRIPIDHNRPIEPWEPSAPALDIDLYRQNRVARRGVLGAGRNLTTNEIEHLQEIQTRLTGEISSTEAYSLEKAGSEAFKQRTGRAALTAAERRLGIMWHEQGVGRGAGSSPVGVQSAVDAMDEYQGASIAPARTGVSPAATTAEGATTVAPATTSPVAESSWLRDRFTGIRSSLNNSRWGTAVNDSALGSSFGRGVEAAQRGWGWRPTLSPGMARGINSVAGMASGTALLGAILTKFFEPSDPAATDEQKRAAVYKGFGTSAVLTALGKAGVRYIPAIGNTAAKVSNITGKLGGAFGRWLGPAWGLLSGYRDTEGLSLYAKRERDQGRRASTSGEFWSGVADYGLFGLGANFFRDKGFSEKASHRIGLGLAGLGAAAGVAATILTGGAAAPAVLTGMAAIAAPGIGRIARAHVDPSLVTGAGGVNWKRQAAGDPSSSGVTQRPPADQSASIRNFSRNYVDTLLRHQRTMGEEVVRNLAAATTEFRRESPNILGNVVRGRLRSLMPTEFSGLGSRGMSWGMPDSPRTGLGAMARMGRLEGIIDRMGYSSLFGHGLGTLSQEQGQAAESALRSKMDASLQQFGEWASSDNSKVRRLGQAMLKASENLDKFGTGQWKSILNEIPAELRGSANQWARNMRDASEQVAVLKDRAEIFGTHQKVGDTLSKLLGGVGPTGRMETGRIGADMAANMLLNRLAPGRVRSPFEMQREAAQQAEQQFRSGAADLYEQTIRGRTPRDRSAARGAWQALQALQNGDTRTYNNIFPTLPRETQSAVRGLARAAQVANWQPPRRGEIEEQMLSAAYGTSSEFLNYTFAPEQFGYLMGWGMEMSPVVMGRGAARGGRDQYGASRDYMRKWGTPNTADLWSGYSGRYSMSDYWGRTSPSASWPTDARYALEGSGANGQFAASMKQLQAQFGAMFEKLSNAATTQLQAAEQQAQNGQDFGNHVARMGDSTNAAAAQAEALAYVQQAGSNRTISPAQIQGEGGFSGGNLGGGPEQVAM